MYIILTDYSLDLTNFVGAVINDGSYKKIMSYVNNIKSGKDTSSRILAGGNGSDEKGYFIEPTVVLATNPKAPTMVDELFGPVVTVYVYPAEKYEETVSNRTCLQKCIFIIQLIRKRSI
jgi:1-pyrroline-5-carboxylate dehydrogenase